MDPWEQLCECPGVPADRHSLPISMSLILKKLNMRQADLQGISWPLVTIQNIFFFFKRDPLIFCFEDFRGVSFVNLKGRGGRTPMYFSHCMTPFFTHPGFPLVEHSTFGSFKRDEVKSYILQRLSSISVFFNGNYQLIFHLMDQIGNLFFHLLSGHFLTPRGCCIFFLLLLFFFFWREEDVFFCLCVGNLNLIFCFDLPSNECAVLDGRQAEQLMALLVCRVACHTHYCSRCCD